MNLPRLKILVADVAALDAAIRSILAGDELTFAHSRGDVENHLASASVDLIVVCEKFETQGFDLLRAAAERKPGAPVACIRMASALAAPPAPDHYRNTVMTLGAKALADLRAASAVEYDRIRRIFYGCIDRSTRMLKSSAYTRMLRLALETVGGREHLAAYLGVTSHELMKWLSGAELPPFTAYCGALDIVAAGPFAGPGAPAAQADVRLSKRPR
ncbi:MAG TPA: hypothetical protein VFB08_04105 [Burkholderiales bacterium]|nr:hypothetical protein [Burkholderiales bacterium]